MAGLSKYEGKDKRRMRLRNHIARDLRSGPKYGQRIEPGKRKHDETEDYFNLDYEDE